MSGRSNLRPSRAAAHPAGHSGRGVAPTVLAVVAALTMVLAAACSSGDEGGSSSTTIAKTTTTAALVGALTPISDVLPGQCFNLLPDPKQQPFAVLLIACEDAHTYEVFASQKYAAGPSGNSAPYPGALVVANNAENQCFEQFAGFMGIQWEASDYDIQAWWPSQASWTEKKDRTVLCAVYRVTGGTTKGSVAGSDQ